MPIDDMRRYLADADSDAAGDEQIRLLADHDARLAEEERRLAVRREYLALKMRFWRSSRDGDEQSKNRFAAEAAVLASEMRRLGSPAQER